MDLSALVLSLLAVLAVGIMWRRHTRIAGRLEEATQMQVDAHSQLERTMRETMRDVELTLDRVRKVERDRTALMRSVDDLDQRLVPVERARTKAAKDLETLVGRVRTLEADRTKLIKGLAEAERSIGDHEDWLANLKPPDSSKMPSVPRAELQLSGSIREIQTTVKRA